MIFGMDFSSLEETEKQGAVFRVDGKPVDLVEVLARCGVTSARLRLWNDPYGKNGEPYMGEPAISTAWSALPKGRRTPG